MADTSIAYRVIDDHFDVPDQFTMTADANGKLTVKTITVPRHNVRRGSVLSSVDQAFLESTHNRLLKRCIRIGMTPDHPHAAQLSAAPRLRPGVTMPAPPSPVAAAATAVASVASTVVKAVTDRLPGSDTPAL